jgi:hypothetical protein
LTAPPQILDIIKITVPIKNKCLFPHILADGTKNIDAIATPSKYHPVRIAILVNLRRKYKDKVKVFAARMGPRQVAKIETMDRIVTIRSRFHNGQFRGSFGSSEGWGMRTIGTGPEVSYFRFADTGAST